MFFIFIEICYNNFTYMFKLMLKKSVDFKLINNIIGFAVFHDADVIHIEKSNEPGSLIEVRFFNDDQPGPVWFLPKEFDDLLWVRLLSLAKIDDYNPCGKFLIEDINGPVHCLVEHFNVGSSTKLIIKLSHQEHNTNWSEAQFDSTIATKVLTNLEAGSGLAIISGVNLAFSGRLAYVLLKGLAHDHLCVATLESPIMTKLNGINQCQWQEGLGLSYQQVFEHILEQDADVIYISDVDKIKSHSLSTSASNKLIIGRTDDKSIVDNIKEILALPDGKILLKNLKFILNVYLVKQNCPHCLTASNLNKTEINDLAKITGLTTDEIGSIDFAHSLGCPSCNYQGFDGQIPLYDILFFDKELVEIISLSGLNKKNIELINESVELNALEDAWLKAKLKLISGREIIDRFKN